MPLKPKTLNYYSERARDILIDVAKGNRKRNIIFYEELMDEMGGPGRGYIGQVLEEVCCSEFKKGHPLLSAIVIHRTNRSPGYGFWCVPVIPEKIKNASEVQKRVFWLEECEKVWRFW